MHSIQLLYSFDPIFIFIQFNPSIFIQSSDSFIQFWGLGQGENLSGSWDLQKRWRRKCTRMQDEIFEHVVSRTGEILSQNLFASGERHISD